MYVIIKYWNWNTYTINNTIYIKYYSKDTRIIL